MTSQDQVKLQELINQLSNIRVLKRDLFLELQKASNMLLHKNNGNEVLLYRKIQSVNTQINRNTAKQRRLEKEIALLFAEIYESDNSGISAPDQNNNSPNS
jgi:hypothetical protein